MDLGVGFLSSIKSILHFKAWSERIEIMREIHCDVHCGHPKIVSQSPQNTSQIVLVQILVAGEVAADFAEHGLIVSLQL